MAAEDVFEIHEPELAPEPPPQGARVWAGENLFSSPTSAVFTLFSLAIVILFAKAILGFILDDGRRWEAVWTNMRLYMTQSYPADQYIRIWVSVGTVIGLAAASLAVWRVGGRISVRSLLRIGLGLGVTVVGMALLSAEADAVRVALGAIAALGGLYLAVVSSGVLELKLSARRVVGLVFYALFLLVGAVLVYFSVSSSTEWSVAPPLYITFGLIAAACFVVLRLLGDRAKEMSVHVLAVAVTVAIAIIGSLWVVPYGQYTFVAGEVGFETGTVATTTSGPWTVILGVGIALYFLFRALTRSDQVAGVARRILTLLWVLSLPFLVLVVMRDPDFNTDKVSGGFDFITGIDVMMFLGFAVGGGAVIAFLSLPRLGETARVIAAILFIGAIGLWLFPMLIRFRLLALLFALMAIGAPTFAGDRRSRVRYVALWVGMVLVLVYLFAVINTPSSLQIQAKSFIGGLNLTFILALTSIFLSFPIGVLMALGRTSTMPIFRVMSTVYIELVRGIPFITVLIFFDLILVLFLPEGLELESVTTAILAGTLFSGAYLAENVRGGLQAINKGQYEAANALGLSTLQLTVLIVLPQALRAVVPALVGQTIAIFKDTSLVAIIGLFDFLYIANVVVPAQTNFLGARFENLLFIAAVYWIFTFSFSRASLRIERKLGLGER